MMTIQEVISPKQKKDFHSVPYLIYKDEPNWVCPLQLIVENTFDKDENDFHEHGESTRWVIYDENKNPSARIAAFINTRKAYSFEQPTGGIGFFECPNNTHTAKLLFDTAKYWLHERGMEAMDGPINFGENMLNWGLLVDGFQEQGFGMPYNKPYYKDLFSKYGFNTYFEQYSYHLDLTKPLPERFCKIANWISAKKGFTFEHMRFNNIEKYIADFIHIYEQAWSNHDNFKNIDSQSIKKMLLPIKWLLDEEFIWFAYHKEEPIAFVAMIPDYNQILGTMNGKTNLFSMIRFLFKLKTRQITRTRSVIMGVIPKFQGAGVESPIFVELEKMMKTKPWYTEMELSWVGDFNPKMESMYQSVGAVHAKTHLTLRKLFNETAEFQRAPKMNSKVNQNKHKKVVVN